MNRRIRKKREKQQLAQAIRELVTLAEKRQQKRQEAIDRFLTAYSACKTPEAVMQTLITALAAGLAVWGAVQLLESFQSGGERQRAQALDLIKAGGEIVRTATWEVIPPSRP